LGSQSSPDLVSRTGHGDPVGRAADGEDAGAQVVETSCEAEATRVEGERVGVKDAVDSEG